MKKINADALRVELKGLYNEFKQIRDSSKGAMRDIAEGQMLGILRAVMKVNNAPAVEVDVREEWIPVERGLPEIGKPVLVYVPDFQHDHRIRIAQMTEAGTWYSGGYWWTSDAVTAWRPMLEPPEREEVLE